MVFETARRARAALLLWILVGWVGSSPARASESGEEFANYLLDVQRLSRLEHKAVDTHHKALMKVQARKMNDRAFQKVLEQQVLPQYKQFVQKLKDVKTPNEELDKLHEMYIEGAGFQLRGYTGQLIAIRRHDPDRILLANKETKRGSKLIEQYLKSVGELKKKYRLQ